MHGMAVGVSVLRGHSGSGTMSKKILRTATRVDARGNTLKLRITDKERLDWLIKQRLLPQRGVLMGGEIPTNESARFVIDAAIRFERRSARRKR